MAEGNEPALEATVTALAEGRIVAVKGVGGFHLACRADDERVVGELRRRKHREDKPFALMAAFAGGGPGARRARRSLGRLLMSRERPIVIAPRVEGASVAESVAPSTHELGVMLPYSPLHHLLLEACGAPLVMTSANVSDEPIAYRDEDALERLGSIADLFLLHDRPIETRTDDSVVRVAGDGVLFLRRSRGYVPAGLPLGVSRPTLACGAELKCTFAVAKGDRAWVGHHIGDLKNYETLRSYGEGIEHFERLFAVEPEVVAHDLHPEYLSTKYAMEREGVETVGVQHHHAHLASCLAEHREEGPAIGAIFDGTGLGTDGTIWGGEILAGDARRLRANRPPSPGVDAGRGAGHPPAVADGVRVADRGARLRSTDPAADLRQASTRAEWETVSRLAESGLASPQTSSAGRLFDAVAAICGIRTEVNYEGQAAVELEAAADREETGAYPLPGAAVLDARETIRAILADLGAGVPIPTVAARFHNGIAAGTASGLHRGGRGGWGGPGRALRRCLPEPPAARADRPPSRTLACECSSRACFRRMTAESRSASWRLPRGSR